MGRGVANPLPGPDSFARLVLLLIHFLRQVLGQAQMLLCRLFALLQNLFQFL